MNHLAVLPFRQADIPKRFIIILSRCPAAPIILWERRDTPNIGGRQRISEM